MLRAIFAFLLFCTALFFGLLLMALINPPVAS